MAVGGLRSVRRDEVVAAAPCARKTSIATARRRSDVSGSPSATRPPSPGSERASSAAIAAIPASAAREARRDPLALPRRLAPAPVVEEPLVDGQLDAVGAERVRVAEREARGHDGLAEPSDRAIRTVRVGAIS